ncbi:MAG: hypothetical protein U5K74_03590 [Gemmatimonadaceae bacterium]|nr:hypothetical protein [Gemmatimonadaceae bacterium]
MIERSVVVLPIARTGSDDGESDTGAGIAEDLSRSIARSGVLVLGRMSAMILRERGLEPRQVARELGAASVLTGSMSMAADSLHLSLSLRSAGDGTEQWSAQFDRPVAELVAIEDDVARAVAAKIRGGVADASATGVPRDVMQPAAHALLRRGQGALHRLSAAGIAEAVQLFGQAITRDSASARAHASLALALAVQPVLGVRGDGQPYDRASAEAGRALALDSTIAEAWLARAYVQFGRGANRDAERSFQRAIARDSTMALAWIGFGLLANHVTDYAAARLRLGRARSLEAPLSLIAIHEALVALSEGKLTSPRHSLAAASWPTPGCRWLPSCGPRRWWRWVGPRTRWRCWIRRWRAMRGRYPKSGRCWRGPARAPATPTGRVKSCWGCATRRLARCPRWPRSRRRWRPSATSIRPWGCWRRRQSGAIPR